MIHDADFQKLKNDFEKASVEDKIQIYVKAEGLSQEQYKQLLHSFPLDKLNQLEQALQ